MTEEERQQLEAAVLKNLLQPAEYEIDGERTRAQDPEKQAKALDHLARRRAARNPLRAILPFHFMSGSGER